MSVTVFLGNGPWYKPGYYGVRAGSRWPHFEEACSRYLPFPFFLAYTTSILKQAGYTCKLLDGVAERLSEEEYLTRAIAFRPDVTILEASTASLDTDLRQARAIKENVPETKIVFCGLHVDMFEPVFLRDHPVVDFVLKGEYDVIAPLLVDAIKKGEDYGRVPNLVYRAADSEVRETERQAVVKDLDAIPWPDREQLPMTSYYDLPGGIPEPSLQMWASRGCPFRCIFCVWPQVMYGNHQYRTRDPIDVVDEIEFCAKKWGFRSFYFDDDTFNIGKPRILALCDEIKRRGLNMPWAAMARADTADEEMLAAMKDAGLVGIKYGVESGCQELVDAAQKHLKLEKVEETVKATRKLGIHQHLTFSFGLPGETKETIRQTIDFAKRMNPETIQFSIMTPFPGSKFYRMLEEDGKLLTKDWSRYDGGTTSVVRTDALSGEELEQALRQAYYEWDMHKLLRPLWDFRNFKRVIRQPRHTWHTFKYLVSRQVKRLREPA